MDKAPPDAQGVQPTRDGKHLRDLAEVTSEYAAYSGKAYGLAAVAGVVWIGIALVLRRHSRLLTGTLLTVAPLVWFGALVVARRYYQRYGAVLLNTPESKYWALRGALIAALTAAAAVRAVHVVRATGEFSALGVDHDLATIALVICLVATPLLAVVLTRSSADSLFTMWVAIIAWTDVAPAEVSGFQGMADHVNGLVLEFLHWSLFLLLMLSGVQDHVRYRKIERRLLALRERG